MRRISIIVLLIFALLLGVTFTLKNTQLVTLNYYFGIAWEGPLSWLLIVTFIAGVACGIVSVAFTAIKRRIFPSAKRRKQ